MTNPSPLFLTRDDVPRAAQVMSSAFAQDPLWRYALPNAGQRAQLLPSFFSALLGLAADSRQAYTAGKPLSGVAVWNFPGQQGTKLTPATIARLLALIASPFTFAAFKVRRAFAEFDRLHAQFAPGRHYYLQTIGVAPDAQGKGLASQLIRPFLQQADASGLPAYTETMTPSNVSLYEYYGFETKARVDITGTGLSVWAFLRPARDAGYEKT